MTFGGLDEALAWLDDHIDFESNMPAGAPCRRSIACAR